MVRVLSGMPNPEDRRRFLDAMQDRCRNIDEENNLGGDLTRGVEIVRDRLA